MNLDRSEYGEIYHYTFGKLRGREACRKGWERWQKVLAANLGAVVLHPDGTPMPAPDPNDYWAFATLGPLRYLARINAAFLSQLPGLWLKFAHDEHWAKLLAACGSNPRHRARGFIHNMLVDGYVMDPVVGPAMASAITWLLSSMEQTPIELSAYHLFGYDIFLHSWSARSIASDVQLPRNSQSRARANPGHVGHGARPAVARMATAAALSNDNDGPRQVWNHLHR